MERQFVGFEVYLIPADCSGSVCVTLPIGPALETCTFNKTSVLKLVPVYELPSVSEPENKE